MELFQPDKPFYKGNLHCHTTESDGRLTPDEAKAFYRSRGYDFLAITDHRIMYETNHVEDGMLMLSGMEMDFILCGEVLHLVGIGMDERIRDALSTRNPQNCINRFNACGGRAIVAHPAWSLNTLSTLSALRGVCAAEIYNSTSTFPFNGDRADSSHVLDTAAAHGTFFRLVASDDSHRYQGEAGRSYTMVQADELTPQGILSALDEGRFYASQGPRFERLAVEDGRVKVRCSPVEIIAFYSNLVWANGRCRAVSGQTEAEYDLSANPGETFVRVQLVDAEGRSAWSNPIILEKGGVRW